MATLLRVASATSTPLSIINGSISLLDTIQTRIALQEINETQRNQICSTIRTLQQNLQEITVNSNDERLQQALEEVQQVFENCLKKCDELERRYPALRFITAPADNLLVKEMYDLLESSKSMIEHCINVSNKEALATMQNNQTNIEALVRNPQEGIYPIDSTVLNEPVRVEKPLVVERKPGELYVSWNEVEAADYYELQYNRQSGHWIRVDSNNYLLTKLPNETAYEIRVRGVNGRGPGEWSESTVGMFTILPSQPRRPLAVHANSSESVTLIVEKPAVTEGARPVTHIVVEYHTDGDTGLIEEVFSVDELETILFKEEDCIKINLSWHVDTPRTYVVKISHRNEDGDSRPCQNTIGTDRISPGEPVGLTVVYQGTRTIIVKWEKPVTSAYTVDHYEVHWGKTGHTTEMKKTKNCHAVFRKLNTTTDYHFKIRAVNKNADKSEFNEISTKTKSMAAKVAKATGLGAAMGAAIAGGAFALPVVSGVSTGYAAGATVAESLEETGKVTKNAAGTAVGVGAGVAGVAVGILGAPFMLLGAPLLGIGYIFVAIGDDEEDLRDILEKYPDESYV